MERVIHAAQNETLTHAFDRGHTGVKGLGDRLVGLLFMRQAQNMRAGQPAGGDTSFVN